MPCGVTEETDMPVRLLMVDGNREFSGLFCAYYAACREQEIDVVDVAEDGARAAELVRALEPDVVLLDRGTLRENLFRVIREIQNAVPENGPAVFVLLTFCDAACARELRRLGVRYVAKPFDFCYFSKEMRKEAERRSKSFAGV